MTMNYGVTAEGFKRKTKDRLIKEIEEDFERGIKKSVDWNVRSPMGQLSKLSALKISELWEVAEECYHSLFPDSSEGVNLDNSSSLNGVLRKKPTSTRVPVELKVLDGILDSLREDEQIFIPRGSLVLESSEQKIRLILSQDLYFKSSQSEKTIFNVIEPGATPVIANLSWKLISDYKINGKSIKAIIDKENIKNKTGITGRDRESNEEYRKRRLESLYVSGSRTLNAMKDKILSLQMVNRVVIEREPFTIKVSDGPRRLLTAAQIYVDFEDNAENRKTIADTIYRFIPAGLVTQGDKVFGEEIVEEVIPENTTRPIEIRFYKPKNVVIKTNINLTTETQNPDLDNIFRLIQESLQLVKLEIGKPVKYHQIYAAVSKSVTDIVDIEMLIGIDELSQSNIDSIESTTRPYFLYDKGNFSLTVNGVSYEN